VPTGAKCLFHSENNAAGLCSVCGAYICLSCGAVRKGEIVCRRCCSRNAGPIMGEESRGSAMPLNFLKVLKGVFLSPNRFFMGLTQRGNLARALLFAVICELLANGIVLTTGGADMFLELIFGPYITSEVSWYLISAFILLSPFITVVGVFVSAGAFQVTAVLLGGKGSFNATFRVVCYAAATNLLEMVPGIGGFLALFMCIIIYTIGFIYAHQLKAFRAGFTALIPLVVFLVIISLIAMLIFRLLGLDISSFIGV